MRNPDWTEQEIRAALRRCLVDLGADDDLRDADDLIRTGALPSIQLLELIGFVADTWGIEIGPDDVHEGRLSSIDAVVALVMKRGVR
jgi:acyl carrier protein